MLTAFAERKLPMICANPDHQVEARTQLIWCAGALAALYEKLGGKVVYAGKPYAPIYRLAFETITGARGRHRPKGADPRHRRRDQHRHQRRCWRRHRLTVASGLAICPVSP